MRLGALFSGGKDSALAVHRAIMEGHEVKLLISFHPQSEESYMFHHPNTGLTALQAEAMRMPIVNFPTHGVKEKELEDLKKAVESVKHDVDGIIAGALASRYQYERVRRICMEARLETYTPLWGIDPLEEWKELLGNSFSVIITAAACEGLGKEWLGREINRRSFPELKALSEKHRFHLGFEGGEAETFVTDCPLFAKKIRIEKAGKRWDSRTGSGVFEITKACLTAK